MRIPAAVFDGNTVCWRVMLRSGRACRQEVWDKEANREGGDVVTVMHGRSHIYDRRPSHPYKCRDGARRVFTDHADIAWTKREMP